MQENFFFREPETQRMLLDILFIYGKLNPDIGYRQGMHELLAPLLWVVHQDAIDKATVQSSDRNAEGADFMLDVLDYQQREADAFNLFCAVMQTAKSFYEMGDNRDSSPIVAKSKRIHEDLLGTFDSELALHLQVAGVLPQIYAIRWIRLLFGREFDFKDVLRIWDILFAESLRPDIIDMTCVAMLLRIRWDLVEADYSTAITTLTHVKLPEIDEKDPRSLVRDAILLDKNRNAETGANMVHKHTGRMPKLQTLPERTRISLDQVRTPERRGSRTPLYRASPMLSPARFSGPQKQLESLFSDVSGGIKSRAEGWSSVSKAVRGAVGEVRKNMGQQYQPSHSRDASVDAFRVPAKEPTEQMKELEKKLQQLEARNKALGKMLDSALESLRTSRNSAQERGERRGSIDEAFNISLAKIQFVSVYLSDTDIPIPPEDFSHNPPAIKEIEPPPIDLTQPTAALDDEEAVKDAKPTEEEPSTSSATVPIDKAANPEYPAPASSSPPPKVLVPPSSSPPPIRPSLKDASFSFMLGENRHRSSFVSSVNALPEHNRRSIDETKIDPKKRRGSQVSGETGPLKDSSKDKQRPVPGKGRLKGKKEGKGNADDSDEEGWRLSSYRGVGGGSGPL